MQLVGGGLPILLGGDLGEEFFKVVLFDFGFAEISLKVQEVGCVFEFFDHGLCWFGFKFCSIDIY